MLSQCVLSVRMEIIQMRLLSQGVLCNSISVVGAVVVVIVA